MTAIRVIRIYIRTISTNIDHPLSRPNPLEFEIAPDLLHGNGMHSATLQIVCDLISVYITRNSRARVLIWNWTEGRLLYVRHHSLCEDFLTNFLGFGRRLNIVSASRYIRLRPSWSKFFPYHTYPRFWVDRPLQTAFIPYFKPPPCRNISSTRHKAELASYRTPHTCRTY